MGTKVQVSPEEYLSTSFDGLDREYVHGEIRERAMPDELHSHTQAQLIGLFYVLAKQRAIHVRPELRLRLARDEFRIPDVCVFLGERPKELVPSTPPLIAIEIVSDDRLTGLAEKLEEYWKWGVRHVWTADPHMRKLYVYDGAGLHEVPHFSLSELALEVTPEQIF